METQKQVRIVESIRSIESLQELLQTERLRLDLAIQQHQPQGSSSDALETLVQELAEVEQRESNDRWQVAYHLQRLEELDDQVSTFCSVSLNQSTRHPDDVLKPKIQHTKDDLSLKKSIRELHMSAMGTDTHTPSDV